MSSLFEKYLNVGMILTLIMLIYTFVYAVGGSVQAVTDVASSGTAWSIAKGTIPIIVVFIGIMIFKNKVYGD